MKEVRGNLWDYHDKGCWIAITTNGNVKANGHAVMGRGVALEAARRFPTTPYIVGKYLKELGNIPIRLGDKMYTFPTKHNWWDKSDLVLIENSARSLADMVDRSGTKEIYLPRPGCGNGQLDWEDVKPILEKYLDDKFIVVSIV
ncbi:hypothetical protein LCGC14_1519630 [marine sediment metagenome]|uniref:Macro domain-containing protein n=1 Tax=marine sediment metagenome TaxID=412755 RepID=A0A0F9M039_9ZZZZ